MCFGAIRLFYVTLRNTVVAEQNMIERFFQEWFNAVSLLEELEMEEGFMQEYESASHYYRPDFNDKDKPFKDIRDFQ